LIHELRVHQIELEMQNEELRRAHEELEAARGRYFDLYELAPVGYVTTSESGLIQEANLTAAALLGETRGALVKQPFARFIHEEDQDTYYLHRKLLFETQSTPRQGSAQASSGRACELRMLKQDGTVLWVSLLATAARDEGGALTCRVVMSDITECKRAEEVPAFLARTSSGTAGEPFFESLARYLGDSLQMDFVCIDRLEGDGLAARTVAVWCDGKFEDNVTYALKDTPCGDVVGKSVCCFPASVCQFFPRDQVLQDLRAESYVGVTLWSYVGQPIGLIAVIGRRPLTNRSQVEATLQLVAVRAAGELERLDAEHALRVSEERHRTILQTAMDGFWLLDIQGRLLEVNDAYCRMSGHSAHELLAMRVSDLEAREMSEVTAGHIRKVIARGEDRFESRHRRKDGSVFDIEISVQYQPGEGGRLVGFLRDITERKHTELALQESEEKYRLVAEFTHNWEWWLGPDGRFRYVSPSCQRITGYAADEFMSDPDLLLRIVHPEDAAAVREHLRVALLPGPRTTSLNFRIITRDGVTRWIGHSCQAVRGKDGEWMGERASNRDITRWMEEQQQLRLRTGQLEALQQIGVSLTSELDLETLLHSIVSKATAMFQASSGALYIYRAEVDALEWSVGAHADASLVGSLLKRGEGLSGQVWETGQVLAVADYRGWPGRAAVYERQPIGSVMGAPIRWGDELLGVLNVVDSHTRVFTDDEKRQLELFANVAAVAMRNARALSDEADQRRQAQALARAATAIANASDLGAMLHNLLDSAISAVRAADGGAIFLRDEEHGTLIPRAVVGLADDVGWSHHFPTDLVAALLDNCVPGDNSLGRPLTVTGQAGGAEAGLPAPVRSVIAAPLRIRDREIGSVMLTSCSRPDAFTPDDQSLLVAFADQSVIAVEHARLLEEAQGRAVLEERQRLARDLHDSVTQSLYGLTLFTHAAREWADAGDLESTRGQLAQVADTAQQALKDMRLLVYELRPADFAAEGLVGALRHRLNSVERRAGIDAHIWVELEADLPAPVEDAFYRVAQEALNNAVKHAAARRVDVYLRSWPGGAEVEVKDDGAGFDPVQASAPGEGHGGGMGLTTMRERSERIGGIFSIQSAPGQGAIVRTVVALPDGRQVSP
jgi:PAS domain S-box-containing protein